MFYAPFFYALFAYCVVCSKYACNASPIKLSYSYMFFVSFVCKLLFEHEKCHSKAQSYCLYQCTLFLSLRCSLEFSSRNERVTLFFNEIIPGQGIHKIKGRGLVEWVSRVLKFAVRIRGGTFSKHTQSGWPITTHWSSRPIRAQCAFQKKGLHRDRN